MSDQVLYTYTGKPSREPTEDEARLGIQPSIPPHHPGVPMRDLTVADVEGMPAHLQTTLDASDLYEATPEGKRKRNAIARARDAQPDEAALLPSSKPKAEKE